MEKEILQECKSESNVNWCKETINIYSL